MYSQSFDIKILGALDATGMAYWLGVRVPLFISDLIVVLLERLLNERSNFRIYN